MDNYFKSYKNYFWKWDVDDPSDGKWPYLILVLPNGQTIAYLKSVLNDLRKLHGQGSIPELGTFLLVLIAISDSIQEEAFKKFKNELLVDYYMSDESTKKASRVLENIRALPKNYKTGENRIQLLKLLFEDCHNGYGNKKASDILKKGRTMRANVINSTPVELSNAIIEQDFRPIALLEKRFKFTEDIIKALNKASISEDLVEEIALEEVLQAEDDKSFVEQLTEHKKTYQIGSLIKRIWSGLNIPMHNNMSSTQPLGGVSDITNKGDFGRLLISEFAHDDDMFMSRIVNNEALYIERESPPENNTKERVFLIDNSIKNWGVPKVLSFATTLAITTHPKSDFTYRVCVVGENYTEIPLHSTLNVIEGQHLLSGSLDCANGLKTFFTEDKHDTSREVFFLTAEKNLTNSNLQHVINTNYNAINYIITNNLKGDIHFYKHQNKSRKHFQHIVLPYQDIWNSQLPKPTILKPIENKDLDLEDILLEPLDKSNAIIIPFGNEIYTIQNANLYSLTSKGVNKGLQLIHKDVPNDKTYQYTIISNKNDERVLICFSNIKDQIERLNLETKVLKKEKINKNDFRGTSVLVYTSDYNLIITNKTDFWAVDSNSKVQKLIGKATYHESLSNYQEAISNFKLQLKRNYINYSILKNIDEVNIFLDNTENLFLEFSNFNLEKNKLKPKNKFKVYHKGNGKIKSFNPITHVYLKRISGSKLTAVKHLKETLKLSLKEAKEIADEAPCAVIKNITKEEAKSLKTKIESNKEAGMVCYVKTDYFKTEDGSVIYVENNQFIFRSSNTSIPQFYITAILGFEIAMATNGEFAGNEYFLPVNHALTTISLTNFRTKYINPFLKHITSYED